MSETSFSMWECRRSGWRKQAEDARSPFDIDYARIVHSGSFRRLQGKTQILNLGDSDFYRTRLTHSLEVAQIASGIARQFAAHFEDHPASPYLPPPALIQAVGFTHDLGHPPFGHGGEVALNYCMRGSGGFEGNGQTLRILSRLENFSEDHGADLTRRALLGVLKYPRSYDEIRNPSVEASLNEGSTMIRVLDRKKSKPPKCYFDSEHDVVEWILEPVNDSERVMFQELQENSNKHHETIHKSFDCSIMDIADDIAYGVHDLEDSLALNLIGSDEFAEIVSTEVSSPFLDSVKQKYPQECGNDVYGYFVGSLFGSSGTRKRFISRLVHHFLTNLKIETLKQFSQPLLRYRASMHSPQRDFLNALKRLVMKKVISSASVQHLEFKGQQMVVSVFEALKSDPKSLLPDDAYGRYQDGSESDRVICDYVAGMTDHFLLRTYDRLFSPRMGSVFDKL